MGNTVEGRPSKETWDNVSLDYTIEINEDERLYAEEICKLLEKEEIYPPAKLLELGSGSGHLSACLAQKGYVVSLLDFSTGALGKSKQTFQRYGLNGEFIEGDLFDLSTVKEKYDFVWNSGVMEHFSDENLLKIFKQIRSVMKSKFIFLVPNPDSISYLLMRYNLEGKGKWEYGQEYMRRNYLDIAQKAGLQGRIVGYAASSISIWHFESTFLNDENRKMYRALVDDKMMPQNESYLVAYIVEMGSENSVKPIESCDNIASVEIEKFFAKSAENFVLKNENEKYIAQNQEYLEQNKKYAAQNQEYLEQNKKYAAQNQEYVKQVEELEKYNSTKEKELEELKNTMQAENEKWEEKLGKLQQENTEQKLDIDEQFKSITQLNAQLNEKDKNYQVASEELLELKNNIESLKRELSEEKDLNREYKQKIEQVSTDILPQINTAAAGIASIFDAKWFSRVVAVHAILGALAKEKLINKLKIVVKMALRIVGKHYDLLIDDYRMNIKVAEYIRNIDNLLQIARVGVDTSKENHYVASVVTGESNVFVRESIYSDEPLVSVLLPVYNHAAFIKAAIKGVQDQTYSNWELIILNDGSTDGLLDILKDYDSDPRIKVYTQENQRLPNGLTNLHNLASGQFITWTSADNVMKEGMLSALVEKLLENPNASMVFADVAIIDENGNYKTTGYREMNRDPELPYIMRLPHCTDALDAEADNFINACFMYRAEPVKALNGMYSADLEGLEDYDFWLRLRTFGKIVHLNNKEPLYCYRVHENTMSEDLLKNKLEEHSKRTQKMIKYSQQKDEFAIKSWNIVIPEEIETAKIFEKKLQEINYAYTVPSNKKAEVVTEAAVSNPDTGKIAITTEGESYQIWVHNADRIERRADIYKGFDVSTIAKKVRQTFIKGLFWEYPVKFVDMKVLGTHIDLGVIDVEKTISFIKNNPSILFSFCLLNDEHSEIEKEIADACENVIFMGKRDFGTQMYVYASWTAMFIPPLKKSVDIMPQILLGWNIGKWIFVEMQDKNKAFPFVCSYYYGEKLLGIKSIENIGQAEEILDQYIDYYSSTGAVKNVIAYLNGIAQDILVERPDFKLKHKERKFPPMLVKRENAVPSELKNGYVGLMVDSLDKGGLEQVVAHLARELTARGIAVRVFCTMEAGEVAQKLEKEGYTVINFEGDSKKFEQYIKDERPLLINTHYAKKMLNVIKENNVPAVEVIHNMYVFQNEAFMKAEKKSSQMFKKMIAVSSIVKDVYEKKVLGTASDKITVIGNAADPLKVNGYSRAFTRSLLNIPMDSTVFINVSSIDSRKNQMGLVKAFERFNMTVDSNSYLIIVGNTLSEFYDNALTNFIEAIPCKSNIIKLNYHREIGDLYKAADIFIMPSFFEGWSIAATEALYSGLPIIHSMCGSGKELVDNGKNGILISNPAGDITSWTAEQLMEKMNAVDSGNVDEMVEAMTEMTRNLQEWKNQRGEISQRSIMSYSQEKMIDAYIEIFREVV